jgi:hypothetical protein
MPKSKVQKKKDRERRVAQKKLAETQKRNQEQIAAEVKKAGQKTTVLMAAAAQPQPSEAGSQSKFMFGGRPVG